MPVISASPRSISVSLSTGTLWKTVRDENNHLGLFATTGRGVYCGRIGSDEPKMAFTILRSVFNLVLFSLGPNLCLPISKGGR